MSHYNGCGCNGGCNSCTSHNEIQQAVDDALALEKENLEQYESNAAQSATDAAKEAAKAAESASAAAQSQTNAETAAGTATQAASSVTNTAVVLEETAERIEQAQYLLEEQISTLQTKPVYFEVSSPTSSLVLPETETVFNVRSIYVASARQDVGYGFTFNKTTRTITLADGITADDIAETEEGFILITAICDVYSSDDPTSFPIILAAPDGAGMVGVQLDATGSVYRTVQDKLKEVVSVKDFGAVGDGADDTAAVASADAAAYAAGGLTVDFSDGPYVFTGQPSPGVTWRFDGAPVSRSLLGGGGNFFAESASYTYLPGPHATYQQTAEYIRTLARGSENIGQSFADTALNIHIQKEHWSETSGSPKAGEIDGLNITYRQGGPRVGGGDPLAGISSGGAMNINVQATQGSGASQIMEVVNTVVDVPGLAINRSIGAQFGILNTRDNYYYGMVYLSNIGVQTSAMSIQNTAGSRWNNILENYVDGLSNFVISDLGQLRWQTTGHIFMRMEYDQTSGELVFKNNANAEIFRIGQTRTTATPNAPRISSKTTENITVSDHQRMVVLGSGSPITCNLSATASPGTTVRVIQRDVGVVTFTPAAGALLRNRLSHTKTAGAGAAVTLEVYSNSGGNAAIWYLSGDTAA